MKKLAILLALLMLAACLTACGGKNPAPTEAQQPTAVPNPPTAAPPAEPDATPEPTALTEPSLPPVYTTEAPTDPTRLTMPDFSVETIDGGTFTLSEALQDHELVLINLWASWCGPCASEFPYLQSAWEKNRDKVAVVALSLEPEDTFEVLRDYAAAKGLSFPIGRAEGTGLVESFCPGGIIPTSILVDRNGTVTAVEIGAKASEQEFLDLFDSYLGADYQAPSECTYTVFCLDQYGAGLPGCMLSFCTDEFCIPAGTDGSGTILFKGPPAYYHLEAVTVPQGYVLDEARSQLEVGPYSATLLVYFTKQP